MSKTDISLDKLQNILWYDRNTGLFTWRVKTCRKVVPGMVAGSVKPDQRRVIRIDGKRYRASRLAWFYVTGNWPTGVVDHIDGDPSNDRIENLRNVSIAENVQNQSKAHKRNRSSGLLGVSKFKERKKWRARICTNGVTVMLGWFDTPEEAHQAYVNAKRKLHVTCTL
jgi:hypothetical protein